MNQPSTNRRPTGSRERRLGRHLALVGLAMGALLGVAGCGGSGTGGVSVPTVAPARTYSLQRFQPAGAVVAGRPTTVSFTIQQPSGQTLSAYRPCCEPHDGVDLIIVRADDSHIQYDDSDISPSGRVSQKVVFPTPGRYRVIVDAYPAHTAAGGPINFQLFTWLTVKGRSRAQAVPPYRATEVVDGYRFQIQPHPALKAIQATFLTIRVTDAHGGKAVFQTWRGALAHSIFIHEHSLDYFHTHVCAPGARYCTSALGTARVTGSSSRPGRMRVGVLLPEPGRWRMFLLTYIHGHHIVAPFTLDARS